MIGGIFPSLFDIRISVIHIVASNPYADLSWVSGGLTQYKSNKSVLNEIK